MNVLNVLLSTALVPGLLAQHATTQTRPADDRLELSKIAVNRWIMLHQQSADDPQRFSRQEHGGSCFDSRRNRLILFGSNTHGRNWMNSPMFFDLSSLSWERAYPDDPRSTYTVNGKGLPVAGPKGDHPWAMHTFGAVIYDPVRDEMVICCWPAHMVPGRFTDVMAGLWEQVQRHPTWVYGLKQNAWAALVGPAEHFFPNCAVYDADRHVIIGYRPSGIYELAGQKRSWKKVANKGYFGWHTNAVYDAKHKAVLVFGTNTNSNDMVVYVPASGQHRIMPTPGLRPPADQHNPMCFDLGTGRAVIVVDRVTKPDAKPPVKQVETWLYDLGTDSWTQLPKATLPFGCGMNYNMEYDPNHRLCLLVTGDARQPTTVWALRIELPAIGGRQ